MPRAQTRSKTGKRLTRADGEQLQRSLFEFVDEGLVDSDLERDVACFLDEQEQLLFWYRSVPRRDYFIQGWQPNRIWPDFVAARNIDRFTDGRFAKAFLRKGRFEPVLAEIPVDLITNPRVGLIGAVEMAARLL